MGWIERIYGTEQPRIPVHQLISSVAEAKRGRITANDVQNDFGLTAQDRAEIVALVGGSLTSVEIEDVLVRAEFRKDDGTPLTGCATAADVRTRLGV